MTAWRDPFTGRRLKARFRWAAVLMLLPLLGLAGVSGAALTVGAKTSAQLDRAQQLTNQMSGLDEDVQSFGLGALHDLIARVTDYLATLRAAENHVDADFAALAIAPGLTGAQVSNLGALDSTWRATRALRATIS